MQKFLKRLILKLLKRWALLSVYKKGYYAGFKDAEDSLGLLFPNPPKPIL